MIVGLFAPVWIAGLVRLFRAPELRFARAVGWAYVLLAVVFVISGGKAYYLAGIYPLLLAAGAQPTLGWIRRGRRRLRRSALAAAFVLTAVSSLYYGLPLVPLRSLHDTTVVSLNYDIGETVGWPTYVHEIATVLDRTTSIRARPRSDPDSATTARQVPSTATARRSACRRPTAATWASGTGDRRPRARPLCSASASTRAISICSSPMRAHLTARQPSRGRQR